MQQLRFVASNDDGTYLTVLSDATGEYFAVPVDDALRSALRPVQADRLPRPMSPDGTPPATTALSPREIQVRVRAGELPEDLAVEAGVSTDRIARFATAVLQERSRVAAEARRARARRGGAEGELVVFGDAVDARFIAHGIDPAVVLWDAVRDADGPWTISAAWSLGQVSGGASWTFELGPRLMTPDDPTAVELLSDRPVPPRASLSTPPAVEEPETPAAADPHAGNVRHLTPREDDGFFDQEAIDDGIVGAGPVAPVTQLSSFFAPAASPQAPPASGDAASGGEQSLDAIPVADAFPAADSFPAADAFPMADANAPTDQIPHIDQFPDAAPPAAPPAAVAPGSSDDGLFPAPGTIGIDDSAAETMDLPSRGEDDSAERRARIPSWDDILLGVRRKRD